MTTTPDFRAELQRLVDLYEALGGNWSPHGYTDTWNDALASARIALTTPLPEPKGAQAIDPVKEKAAAAVEKQLFPWRDRTTLATPLPEPTDEELLDLFQWHGALSFARAALERWGHG